MTHLLFCICSPYLASVCSSCWTRGFFIVSCVARNAAVCYEVDIQ